jgi:uncharacterized phage protein gp47/JayE
MPFDRPTLTALREQTAADIDSALDGAEVLLRFSNLKITAAIQAALANGHYGYIDYIAKQATPFTATDVYLEGWAGLKGVTRKPATSATGSAQLAGTSGTVIPAGTALLRNDGFAYATTAEATLGGSGATVAIAASAAGVAGNAPDATGLSLVKSISGVSASAVASGPLTGGAEIENDDSLRSRMLAVFAQPPQGGSGSDYDEWSRAVPGVTRCWVVPAGMGPGTIVLYFMMDDAEAAHGGFPQGTNGVAAGELRDTAAIGDQLLLANAIFLKQPVTPIVYAVAPRPNTIALTIAGLSSAPSSLRNAIAAAVTSALLLNATPGGVTNVSVIEGAIAAVNGSAGFVITAITASNGSVTPGSAGNIVSDIGRLPVLGSIGYV